MTHLMGDAGFEPGTSKVWCTTNEPPHLTTSHHISQWATTSHLSTNNFCHGREQNTFSAFPTQFILEPKTLPGPGPTCTGCSPSPSWPASSPAMPSGQTCSLFHVREKCNFYPIHCIIPILQYACVETHHMPINDLKQLSASLIHQTTFQIAELGTRQFLASRQWQRDNATM